MSRRMRGASTTEYLILLSILAVGLISAILAFGGKIRDAFQANGEAVVGLGEGALVQSGDLRPGTIHGALEEQAAPGQGGQAGASILGGLSRWGRQLGERVQNFRQQFTPSPEEREGIEYIHGMLEPGKLGGADRTFNQNDIDRIIDSLLEDPAVRQQIRDGIREEAFRRAANAPSFMSGVARRIADKRTTPGTRAYRRHYGEYWAQGQQEARERIRGEMEQALADEAIQPIDGQGPSGVPRDVSLAELERFQRSAELLQNYSDRVSDKLGVRYELPHGLSQEDVDAILNNRPPPNGRAVKADSPR